ncbi:hypothetical protein F2Q69_00014615 [Brassica cretica]|uniref:Uncharacterized protein n=1 Tax=Brassica cretica TaxID=69181 RepID=A0A8S9QIP1_BRACR|nr:hypothetical protein F2Q69_00014615 [Brassica cretica]
MEKKIGKTLTTNVIDLMVDLMVDFSGFFTNLSLLGSGRSQTGELVGGYSPAHFEGLSVNHFNVISVYFCCFLWILSEERISQWNGPVSPTMLLLGPDFELRSAYYVAKWTSNLSRPVSLFLHFVAPSCTLLHFINFTALLSTSTSHLNKHFTEPQNFMSSLLSLHLNTKCWNRDRFERVHGDCKDCGVERTQERYTRSSLD